jgi:hypothetical protein
MAHSLLEIEKDALGLSPEDTPALQSALYRAWRSPENLQSRSRTLDRRG